MVPAAKRGLLYCVTAATCSSAGSWTGETNTVYRRRKRFSRSRRTHSVCGGRNAHAADSRCRSMTQMRTDNAHPIRRRYSQVWVAEPPAAVRPHGRHLSGCCRCPRNRPVIRDTPMLAIRGRAGGRAGCSMEGERKLMETNEKLTPIIRLKGGERNGRLMHRHYVCVIIRLHCVGATALSNSSHAFCSISNHFSFEQLPTKLWCIGALQWVRPTTADERYRLSSSVIAGGWTDPLPTFNSRFNADTLNEPNVSVAVIIIVSLSKMIPMEVQKLGENEMSKIRLLVQVRAVGAGK